MANALSYPVVFASPDTSESLASTRFFKDRFTPAQADSEVDTSGNSLNNSHSAILPFINN